MEERSEKPAPTVTFVYIRVFRFTSKSEFRLYADKATDQKKLYIDNNNNKGHRQQQKNL